MDATVMTTITDKLSAYQTDVGTLATAGFLIGLVVLGFIYAKRAIK